MTTTTKKALKLYIELNIHAVDAPGTRLRTNENLALNICLLGQHQRTRFFPAQFPLHIGQTFHFEKVFRNCSHPRDVLQRLERKFLSRLKQMKSIFFLLPD